MHSSKGLDRGFYPRCWEYHGCRDANLGWKNQPAKSLCSSAWYQPWAQCILFMKQAKKAFEAAKMSLGSKAILNVHLCMCLLWVKTALRFVFPKDVRGILNLIDVISFEMQDALPTSFQTRKSTATVISKGRVAAQSFNRSLASWFFGFECHFIKQPKALVSCECLRASESSRIQAPRII